MSNGNGTLRSVTSGGIAAEHVAVPNPPAFVAATISGKDHNTIKSNVIPFGCWRAEDVRFEFDSSFIRPDINTEVGALKDLIDDHTLPDAKGDPKHKPPLTVFGHADPTGNEDYNKILSGRRAQAMYGMLVRDVELWEDLFSNSHGRDKWDPVAIRTMLETLGRPTDQKPTGASRKALFKDYMDFVCTIRDEAGQPIMDGTGQPERLLLTKGDFLAAGTDPKGKGDFQGCGEFNPNRIFSQLEQREFAKDENKPKRDAENAPNRRVLIFLFRPGIHVRPEEWPCPRAKEGVGACRKRLWSDAADRLAPGAERREFQNSQDTFACRFYHRLSDRSPCEGGRPLLIGLLHMQIFDGEGRTVLAGRKYKIRLSTAKKPLFSGVLNDNGILRHDFVPDGNYLLRVEGCDEETPMIVMDPSDQVPTVRYLETSSLTVFVRTTEGAPIEDASVTVKGVGEKKSNADGVADFGRVDPGEFEFRVVKGDHTPARAALQLTESPDLVKLSDSASGTVKVEGRKAKPIAQLNAKPAATVKITEISGTLAATKTLSNPPPPPPAISSLPDNDLKASTSDAATPIDHVVLVRHKAQIVLEAITAPAGQPVDWTVVQNQSSGQVPNFVPEAGGTKLRIDTNRAGSFSAIASTKGGSKLRWNFVIVGVEVDVARAKVNVRDLFEDAFKKISTTPSLSQFNIPPTHVGAICGEFTFSKHAWDSELKIKLVGGGTGGDVGIDRVTPRFLQNLVLSNVVGEYGGGVLGHAPQNNPVRRIVDVGGTHGSGPGPEIGKALIPNTTIQIIQWPVSTAPGMMELVPDPGDKSRFTLRMGDSPASGGFEAHIKTLDIQKISGFLKFAATVASWSTDAPNSVAVHAAHEWLVDYAGIVTFPNGAKNRAEYAPKGAHVTNVTAWHLMDPANGGAGATESVMEIFGPLLTTVASGSQVNKF